LPAADIGVLAYAADLAIGAEREDIYFAFEAWVH
jgi:hypothetical protein